MIRHETALWVWLQDTFGRYLGAANMRRQCLNGRALSNEFEASITCWFADEMSITPKFHGISHAFIQRGRFLVDGRTKGCLAPLLWVRVRRKKDATG
nr:hypothetical protein [uncultured Cohaesibacter sp.]